MEGTITDILPQERRRGKRFNVFLDHRYAFSLHADLAGSLRVGQVLSGAEVDELLGADQLQRAVEGGLNFLSYRPRSEQEVRRRLGRTHPPQVVEAVLEKLRDWKLVDDAEFARFWVEQRQTFRPRGSRLLKQELRQRGIEATLAAEISEAVGDPTLAAYRAAERKARGLKGLDYLTFRQRLGAFLARRGFDWETIGSVVQRVWSEQGGEQE